MPVDDNGEIVAYNHPRIPVSGLDSGTSTQVPSASWQSVQAHQGILPRFSEPALPKVAVRQTRVLMQPQSEAP
ncbi:hypothetical protein Ac2012v2_001430 [Leucoagaricus gongylophorus]